MRISDWSSDVCSSDLTGRGDKLVAGDPSGSGWTTHYKRVRSWRRSDRHKWPGHGCGCPFASAPDTDDGAPTSVSISAPVATLDSIEHVMHQPGACGRIMLSEEAVHAKFVAVAQITPTKCYAGSFPCRERPEIHDKFHGSAVKQRSDHTIHILQDPVYLASVAHRKPLLERVPADRKSTRLNSSH